MHCSKIVSFSVCIISLVFLFLIFTVDAVINFHQLFENLLSAHLVTSQHFNVDEFELVSHPDCRNNILIYRYIRRLSYESFSFFYIIRVLSWTCACGCLVHLAVLCEEEKEEENNPDI